MIPTKTCKTTKLGREYIGKQNKTISGKTCQRWDSQTPHKHNRNLCKFPDLAKAANFCRNPDKEDEGPWCYTMSRRHRWEYCPVPFCPVKN